MEPPPAGVPLLGVGIPWLLSLSGLGCLGATVLLVNALLLAILRTISSAAIACPRIRNPIRRSESAERTNLSLREDEPYETPNVVSGAQRSNDQQ